MYSHLRVNNNGSLLEYEAQIKVIWFGSATSILGRSGNSMEDLLFDSSFIFRLTKHSDLIVIFVSVLCLELSNTCPLQSRLLSSTTSTNI